MDKKTVKSGKVTLDSGEEWTGTYAVSWAGATERQRDNWAASNRWIVFQRGLRKLSLAEVENMTDEHGVLNFNALTAGQKVMSEQERIEKLVALGIPANVAKLALQNPDLAEKMIAEMTGEDDE